MTIGIDLGKSVCSMTGLDEAGAVVLRRRVSRGKLVELIARIPHCVVAMEACCGAHQLGRVTAAQGHEVRLMAPRRRRGRPCASCR
jgi:transposase